MEGCVEPQHSRISAVSSWESKRSPKPLDGVRILTPSLKVAIIAPRDEPLSFELERFEKRSRAESERLITRERDGHIALRVSRLA